MGCFIYVLSPGADKICLKTDVDGDEKDEKDEKDEED